MSPKKEKTQTTQTGFQTITLGQAANEIRLNDSQLINDANKAAISQNLVLKTFNDTGKLFFSKNMWEVLLAL